MRTAVDSAKEEAALSSRRVPERIRQFFVVQHKGKAGRIRKKKESQVEMSLQKVMKSKA